jgi:hypothetical protein
LPDSNTRQQAFEPNSERWIRRPKFGRLTIDKNPVRKVSLPACKPSLKPVLPPETLHRILTAVTDIRNRLILLIGTFCAIRNQRSILRACRRCDCTSAAFETAGNVSMQPVAESVRHMVEADIADGMGALPGRKFKISESIEHELHWGSRASD